jgi:monoamine oxidase
MGRCDGTTRVCRETEVTDHRTTRRQLLGAAGVGAAALALPRAAYGATQGRAVIVGAGLAGLSAAYELHRKGWDVVVLEASNRVGGRVKTVRAPFTEHQHAEAGGEYVNDAHYAIRDYARRFGIALEDTYDSSNDGYDAVYLRRRRMREEAVETPSVRDEMSAYADAMDALGDPIDPADAPAAPRAAELDRRSVGDLFDDLGLSPDARFLLDQDIRDDYLVEPSDLSLLFHAAEWELPGTPAGAERYRLRGGNDRLPRALANTLPPGSLLLNQPVVAIAQNGAGVRATTAAALTVAADALVLAAPLPALRTVTFDPGLPDALQKAIADVQYGLAAKTLLQYEARLWRAGDWSGSAFSDLPASTYWEATDGQPGKAGIMLAYTAAGDGVKAAALGDKARVAEAARDAEQIFPAMKGGLRHGVTNTCGYLAYAPGQVLPFWNALRAPVDRIVLAGEHTDLWAGYMNGAIRSGQRAANIVAES